MGTFYSRKVLRPNHTWHIDIIGRLPSSNSCEYALICVDAASKFVLLEPLKKLNSKTI